MAADERPGTSTTVVLFIATMAGGVLLLVLGVWPGLLWVAFFTIGPCILSLPVLACWLALPVVLASRPEARPWAAWSALVTVAVVVTLWLRVPQRVAFSFWAARLEALAASAPRIPSGEEMGEFVGPYWVDRYGEGLDGGIWFRTLAGPDGLGPDQYSYGFVLRPNGGRTPFGRTRLRLHHMFGDWYTFEVSDD